MSTPDAARSTDVEFVDYVGPRQHTLLRAAYLVCGDLGVAEEVLEAALVRLARDWGEVRDERPDVHVRQFLYRDAVASWRRRSQQAPPDETVDTGDEVEDADPDGDDLDGAEDEEAEQRRDVLRALDTLTPRQRAVVVLRHFEDRTEADVAGILGVSRATVTQEAAEARARLASALPRVDLWIGGTR